MREKGQSVMTNVTDEGSIEISNKEGAVKDHEDQTALPGEERTLQVQKLNEGTGITVPQGATVKVHYTGKFQDGTVFDSSRGRDPLEFKVGFGQVIRGWDEGIC